MKAEGRTQVIERLRIVGSLGALALFGFLATGCSLRGSSSVTTSSGPYQVRVWRVDQDVDPLKSSISNFNSDNQGIAQVTYVKKSSQGYELSALKSLAARTGPDIWSIPNTWLGDHVARIQPLPDTYFNNLESTATLGAVDAVKKLYPAGIAEQLISTDGKSVLGAPGGVDVLKLYYNQDIFDSAINEFKLSLGDNFDDSVFTPVRQLLSNPPDTWSTLDNQVKYLTKRSGNTIIRSAIAMGTADNVPAGEETLQLLMMQDGTRIVSSDRTRAMFHITTSTSSLSTTRPGANALNYFASFSNPNKPTYSWNPSMPQALDAFAQGKVAMIIGFSDVGDTLKIKYPNFHFDTAPVPQLTLNGLQKDVNLIKFDVETVTKSADSYEASWRFMQRYTQPDVMNDVANVQGRQTPYLADLTTRSDSFPQKQILSGQAVFEKNRDQFDGAFRQMIVDVSQNGIPVDQSLDNAAEVVNGLLATPDE